MSYDLKKKREHVDAALDALRSGDSMVASFHMGKAAEFLVLLAERTDHDIRDSYLKEAHELISLGAKIKAKAKPVASAKAGKVAASANGDSRAASPGVRHDNPEESEKKFFALTERPKMRLCDVAGLDEVKVELRRKVINPMQSPDVYRKFQIKSGGGVLMYGPPGNGKTFIAKAIAGEVDAAFFEVASDQLKDKYVGETEKKMTALFEEARSHERAILFFDEVDNLLGRTGNQKIGAVTQFLKLADGFAENKNCLLIMAATNKPWLLDAAVIRKGRLGDHVYVGLPDAAARAGIIKYSLKEAPVGEDVTIDALAARTDFYSGAELADICNRAKIAAAEREIERGVSEAVTMEDFTAALALVKPASNPKMIEELKTWGAAGSPTASASDPNDDN